MKMGEKSFGLFGLAEPFYASFFTPQRRRGFGNFD